MDQLGIEPIQLLTQVFNFVVMVILLTKFLYRPIIQNLEARKKKIEEGLEFAEKMKTEMERLDKQRQAVLGQAKEEARRIIEEGKKAGKALEGQIVAKANQEATEIVEKGKREVERERGEMENALKTKTVDVAQSMVEKLLTDVLKPSDHQSIISKKIREIAKLIR